MEIAIFGVPGDGMPGSTTIPWGLWLMALQAGVIGLALFAGLGSARWRVGGALSQGALWLYLGMASFAMGHVSAFTLSLVDPSLPSSPLFLLHHTGALLALSAIGLGLWRIRRAMGAAQRADFVTFLTWTLPFIALSFLILGAAGRTLPVPGAPMGASDMGVGGMMSIMGGTDAMRELSQGVTLGNLGVDGAVLCMGLLAVALGLSIELGGALGRSVRTALIGVAALTVAYPGTTLAAAFQPALTPWLEMGLCFTVTCAFVIFVASVSAARALGAAQQRALVPVLAGPAHPSHRWVGPPPYPSW